MSKRRLLLVLQLGFYAALIWFVIRRFDSLRGSIDLAVLLDNPIAVVLAVLFFGLFYALLAVHWKLICDRYETFSQSQQWLSFLASQPYKYLPSSVFTFSSRAMYAKKLGLPLKQSTVAQAIENFNILGSGFGVAILFLLYDASIGFGLGVTTLAIIGMVAISIVPTIKLPKTAVSLSGKHWIKLLLLAIAGWLAAGVGFYFVILATGLNIDFVSAVAANAMAVALGIVAIFAPGGIGVREFIYNKFSIGNTAIATWRLLTLVFDLIVGAVAIYLIKQKSSHRKQQTTNAGE